MSRSSPQKISERAFAFAVRVVKLSRTMDGQPGASRALANQLLHSGTFIGANLAESKGGQSRAACISKVSATLKEARGTHYWIRLIMAADIIPGKQLESILNESNQIVSIITVIAKKLKSNELLTLVSASQRLPSSILLC